MDQKQSRPPAPPPPTSQPKRASFNRFEPIMLDPSQSCSPTSGTGSQCGGGGGGGGGGSGVAASSLMMATSLSDQSSPGAGHMVYRLALTGGPCSGKTTGQARISTFFENLGWKVFRVPETATTLLSGGIRFPELSPEEAEKFQENLIKVMISIERTFFTLAQSCDRNCLVICDRGVMDATAYMSHEAWQRFLRVNKWNTIDLRDNRYNQVIHLVTSADGAEEYYNMEGNPVRTEGLQLARQLDRQTMEAWVGHPYMDVIDNSTDFDTKMRRMISAVCKRIGIEAQDRLQDESRKVKYLVQGPAPDDGQFPPYQDFEVVHDYLISSNPKIQSRVRKRGQNGHWSYQQTVRRSDAGSQMVELRRQITHRDYVTLLAQRDDNHHTIYKTRRCFLWQQTYFQMDIYQAPRPGLILLECYTTLTGDTLKAQLPTFLNIVRDVTDDPDYSMFELSKRTTNQATTTTGGGGGGTGGSTGAGSVVMATSLSDQSSTGAGNPISYGPERKWRRHSSYRVALPPPLTGPIAANGQPAPSTDEPKVCGGGGGGGGPDDNNNNSIESHHPAPMH